MSRRGDNIPLGDLAWRIDLSYFANFFKKAFWEMDVARSGIEALHPSKAVGYQFLLKGGVLNPLWPPMKSSIPEGYGATQVGDIEPQQAAVATDQIGGEHDKKL